MSKLTHIHRLSSSWFHLVGLYLLKALLTNVFLFVVGISSKLSLVFDLRPSLLYFFLMISSCRYFVVCLLSEYEYFKVRLLATNVNPWGTLWCYLLIFCLRWFLLQSFVYIALHFINFFGRPASIELQWSRCDGANDLTNVWHVLLSMYFLVFLIHIRFTIVASYLLLMWALNCSDLLRICPRYLTWSHLVIFHWWL